MYMCLAQVISENFYILVLRLAAKLHTGTHLLPSSHWQYSNVHIHIAIDAHYLGI